MGHVSKTRRRLHIRPLGTRRPKRPKNHGPAADTGRDNRNPLEDHGRNYPK